MLISADEETALHVATRANKVDVVRLLLEKGAPLQTA